MTKIILKRNIQLIFVFVIIIQSMSFAQDIIYKKSNDSIVCNIIEVKASYISYKLNNSTDTNTYKILLEDYEYFTKQTKYENNYSVNYKISNQQLKKGAYLTFQEYLNNNPSVLFEFEVITRTDNQVALWGGKKFRIISKDKNVKHKRVNNEFWGLCDGTDCYINCKNLNGHNSYSFLTREKERAFFYSLPIKNDKKNIKNKNQDAIIAGVFLGGLAGAAIMANSGKDLKVLYLLNYKTGSYKLCGNY